MQTDVFAAEIQSAKEGVTVIIMMKIENVITPSTEQWEARR